MSSVKLSMNLSFHLMISLPDVHFTLLHIPLMGINRKQIMLGASELHVCQSDVDGGYLSICTAMFQVACICVIYAWMNVDAKVAHSGLKCG